MIPIQFKGNETDVVQQLYNDLINEKLKNKYKSEINEINDWCIKNIIIDGKSLTFEDVIKADFGTLGNIVEILNNKHSTPPPLHKTFIVDYLYNQKLNEKSYRLKFVDYLGVTVCPYCNRNFVNSAKERTMCQFDHFYNKSDFPLLAISFYNLVTVCGTCNHTKRKNDVDYSPHDKKYKTCDLVHFDFSLTGMDYLFNTEDLRIEIDGNTNYKKNIEVLKLNELYQLHTDIVQECIKKTMIFNPGYINYLLATYKSLFGSKEELYKLVFGNYIDEESFGKRPLSKLTHDIYEDLFDIYYGFKL